MKILGDFFSIKLLTIHRQRCPEAAPEAAPEVALEAALRQYIGLQEPPRDGYIIITIYAYYVTLVNIRPLECGRPTLIKNNKHLYRLLDILDIQDLNPYRQVIRQYKQITSPRTVNQPE